MEAEGRGLPQNGASNQLKFQPVDYVLSDSGVVDDFSLDFSRGF